MKDREKHASHSDDVLLHLFRETLVNRDVPDVFAEVPIGVVQRYLNGNASAADIAELEAAASSSADLADAMAILDAADVVGDMPVIPKLEEVFQMFPLQPSDSADRDDDRPNSWKRVTEELRKHQVLPRELPGEKYLSELQSLSTLIEALPERSGIRQDATASMAAIRRNVLPGELSVAVVGEFSAGKSTLINALLRDAVLPMDVVPGTTSVPTTIRQASELDARVSFHDGINVSFASEGLTAWKRLWRRCRAPKIPLDDVTVRDFINYATSDERTALDVAEVVVFHHATCLSDRVTLIDTPGLNLGTATDALTARIVREVADAVVVVIPAINSGSVCLWNFLRTRLNDSLHRCVFVVSQIDKLATAAERGRMLSNLETRMHRELGLEKPAILSAAPLLVVDDEPASSARSLSPDDVHGFRADFSDVERRLWNSLLLPRDLLIRERCLRRSGELLANLRKDLRAKSADWSQVVESFRKQQQTDRFAAFMAQVATFEALIAEAADSAKQQIQERVDVAIKDIGSASELQAFAERSLRQLMDETLRSFQSRLDDVIRKTNQAYDDEFRQFQSDLSDLVADISGLAEYKSLASPVDAQQSLQLAPEPKLLYPGPNTVAAVAGCASGAILGTAILPGIGMVLGGIVGALFQPAIAEQKQVVRQRTKEALDSYLSRIQDHAMQSVARHITDAKRNIAELIDNSVAMVRQLMESILVGNESARREWEDLGRRADTVFQELQRRREELVDAVRQFSSREEYPVSTD